MSISQSVPRLPSHGSPLSLSLRTIDPHSKAPRFGVHPWPCPGAGPVAGDGGPALPRVLPRIARRIHVRASIHGPGNVPWPWERSMALGTFHGPGNVPIGREREGGSSWTWAWAGQSHGARLNRTRKRIRGILSLPSLHSRSPVPLSPPLSPLPTPRSPSLCERLIRIRKLRVALRTRAPCDWLAQAQVLEEAPRFDPHSKAPRFDPHSKAPRFDPRFESSAFRCPSA
jgi:hypothetical protein